MKSIDQILLENAYSSVLFSEANISNEAVLIDEIEQLLDEKEVQDSSPIRQWFKTQYLKWFKSNVDDDKKSAIPHQYKEGEPEWMSREGVMDFSGFKDEQKQKLSHMVDYFKTLSDIDLKSLYKEPLKVIEDKMSKWEKTLAKKINKSKLSPLVEGIDFEVISKTKDSNGAPMCWVKLLTKEAFKFEGDSMGHCVGGYNPNKSGLSIISLYDEDNLPHVTLEIQEKRIKQIKGKQNAAPIEKYLEACMKFVRYLTDNKGYEVVGDGKNIGMASFKDKFYYKDSEQWNKIHTTEIIPMQEKAFEALKKRIVVVASESYEYVLEYLKPLRSKYV
jgi:hypothetical protein